MVEVRVYMVIKPPTRNAVHFAPFSKIIFAPHHILLIFYNSQQSKIKNQLSKAFLVILTSSAIDKKLEIDKKTSKINSKFSKKLEIKLQIYKNLENKLEIFEFFVNGRWTQFKTNFTFKPVKLYMIQLWTRQVLPTKEWVP